MSASRFRLTALLATLFFLCLPQSARAVVVSRFDVCTDTARQTYPDISGSRVIWYDDCDGPDKLYLRDLASAEEKIPLDGAYAASIWGERVAYGRTCSLWMWRAGTKTCEELTPNPAMRIDIFKDRIAYAANNAGGEWGWRVFLYDVSAGQDLTLTATGMATIPAPSIWGDCVAWAPEGGGVQLYDVSRRSYRTVVPGHNVVSDVAVSGRVAWVQEVTGGTRVEIFNTVTGILSHPRLRAGMPSSVLLWRDQLAVMPIRGPEVWVRDLTTGQEARIVSVDGMLEDVYGYAMWGDTIVWSTSDRDQGNIYGARYSFPPILTTPNVRKTRAASRVLLSRGYTKPRLRPTDPSPTILCERYEAGRWVLRRRLATIVTKFTTCTMYKSKYSLARGYWRLRACWPGGAGRRPLRSSYKYTRVI